jgi:hypothetical protein
LLEGTRFFAKANYNRASAGRSPSERAMAIMKVMRYFRYRELPAWAHLGHVLYGTAVYNAIRLIKQRVMRTSGRLATH